MFSNVSSNCLPEMMHNRTGCICLSFLQCVFSNVSSNYRPERIQSHTACLSFLHYVFSMLHLFYLSLWFVPLIAIFTLAWLWLELFCPRFWSITWWKSCSCNCTLNFIVPPYLISIQASLESQYQRVEVPIGCVTHAHQTCAHTFFGISAQQNPGICSSNSRHLLIKFQTSAHQIPDICSSNSRHLLIKFRTFASHL